MDLSKIILISKNSSTPIIDGLNTIIGIIGILFLIISAILFLSDRKFEKDYKIHPVALFVSSFILLFRSYIGLTIGKLDVRLPDIYKVQIVNKQTVYKEQSITKDEYNFIKNVKAKDQLGEKLTKDEINKVKSIILKK